MVISLGYCCSHIDHGLMLVSHDRCIRTYVYWTNRYESSNIAARNGSGSMADSQGIQSICNCFSGEQWAGFDIGWLNLMEFPASNRSKRQTSYRKLYKLTIGGGVTFWVTTIAFSQLPIAAEFRAAFSISYFQVVFIESLIGGMTISYCLSYFLLRFYERIPARNPIQKSVILSFIALFLVLILIYVAASRTSDALNVFLIGAVLNLPRFLVVGMVIGYLYEAKGLALAS
jgi:hypothetical protein